MAFPHLRSGEHWPGDLGRIAFLGLETTLLRFVELHEHRCLVAARRPGQTAADEVVGQWIALAGAASFNWKSWLGAFVLFRLFDIWKPPPARQLDRIPGGVGIVFDDVASGVYAALVLWAAGWFNLY